MSRDVDNDLISLVVLIPCIIASYHLYTNFSYLNSRYTTSWMACSPRLTTRKRGRRWNIRDHQTASPAIMSETRYSSHSWTDSTSVVLSQPFWRLLLENGGCVLRFLCRRYHWWCGDGGETTETRGVWSLQNQRHPLHPHPVTTETWGGCPPSSSFTRPGWPDPFTLWGCHLLRNEW